jgi:hypothetical protein
MSRLVEFYRGRGRDAGGRTLEQILAWSDDDLEEVHDFIQWLFPLPEPSRFNSNAPLLTSEDVAAFKAESLLRDNLARSFKRFLAFTGLTLTAEGKVVEAANFASRQPVVWAYVNHNWLRISRVLRSLTLLGLEDRARAFYAWLEAAYRKVRFPIPPDTFGYWTAAVAGSPL